MQIEEALKREPPRGTALFALGFRPFFLGAGLAGVVLLALWLAQWSGALPANGYYGAIGWHGHEMLFGYTGAAIAGFLLTAVRNWTGVNTPKGMPLALLALLWLAGRVLPFFDLPGALIAAVDLAFLPAVMAGLARPLFSGQNKINRVMLLFLAAMTGANLIVHLDANGVLTGWGLRGLHLMLYLVLFLLLMISGRVLPFFTEAALPGFRSRRRAWVEKATFLLAGALAAASLATDPVWTGIAALLLGGVQAVRLSGWYTPRIFGIPILWVLHSGYVWIIAGLLLTGLAGFGLFPPNLALHGLTVGAIGIFTLGMMARVSLGHTGRMMRSAIPVNVAFVLLNLAVVLRVFGPVALPERYALWVHVAGGLWIAAFSLFTWVYAPILIRPRVDGRPG